MFIYRKAADYKTHILIPLWVLLWKYKAALTYRYCNSTWEIFGGVILFLILFLVYQTAFKAFPEVQHGTIKNNTLLTRVVYSPYNNFTRTLMTRVEDYLTKNETGYVVDTQWDFQSQNLPVNIDSFTPYDTIIAVNFKSNGSLTSDLDYTINALTPGRNNTKLRTIFNGFFRNLVRDDEEAPPFLWQLQLAIDKTFMETVTRKSITPIQQTHLIPIPKYISDELRTLHKFLILCSIIGPLPFFLAHSTRLIVERRSGLRELMKLSGIFSDVLRFSHIIETTLIGVLFAIPVTTILKITSYPILPHSNIFIIGFTTVLHFVNSASLAFVSTALSQDIHHAESLGLIIYLSTFTLDCMWYSYKEFTIMTYIVCIFMPHAPIYLYWDEVLHLETIGQGSNFDNICKVHANNVMSVLRVWAILYAQQAVITIVAWYLDLVRPGRYGVSKKWNFMFRKSFWCREKPKAHLKMLEDINEPKRDQKYFERGPRKAQIAIQVLNVTKIYRSHRGHKFEVTALDSVNFSCYRGEITMLLGANGAGKSTLMFIVAGMFSPSSGTVYVNGINVAHKVVDLREIVGLCMQQNICFKHLTVKENITFFRKLKRGSSEGFTVDQLLKKLKLTEVAYHYSNQLSSGTLRCVQVACTLARDADILVLDEPTTGMDIEIRHRLWDMLMVLRGKKTILMATSFLEEANALGDRIVILNKGVLKCHGTPVFLKNAIGTSFNLTVTIRDSTQLKNVKEMVEKVIPEVNSTIHDTKRLTFSLPTKYYDKFPELFRSLEMKKEEYGIGMMHVGMFMEEVFMEFIEKSQLEHYTFHGSVSYRHVSMDRVMGVSLIRNQMSLLIRRIFGYLLKKKYQVLIMRIIVPIIGIFIVCLTSNHALRHTKIFSHHILSYYSDEFKALVYSVGPFRRRGLFDAMEKYPGVSLMYSLDVDGAFQNPSTGYLDKGTIGIKMADNYTTIYHPLSPAMTSKSINLFSNIFMSIHMPELNRTIRTSYEPLMLMAKDKIKEPKTMFLCLKWTSCITFLSIFPLTPIIALCMNEAQAGTRDNHMMAGCSPIIHWGSRLIAHMSLYFFVVVIPVIVLAVLLEFDKTFTQGKFVGSLFAMLLMFGLAFLAHLYYLSFILDINLAISQIYITSVFFGVVIPILVTVLESQWNTSVWVAVPYFILVLLGRTSPLFAFAVGVARLTVQARFNAYCRLNKHLCPALDSDDEEFSVDTCCQSKTLEPFSYLSSYESGLHDLVNLAFHFLLYGTLVILLEHRLPQYLYEQFRFANYKKPQQAFHDLSVRREKTYVRTALRKHNFADDILLVNNLHKDYANEIRGKHTLNAVKGVTFSAKAGECLAILGPQATGKSSVINMLAGNLVMTRGNACVDGNFIRSNRMKYIHKISLSSAASGMDSFLTGHQNLMFIAKLRGYSEEMACKLSLMALRFMGLQQTYVEVSKYSNGCLRRLSLCSTLMLAPPVAFLDEPMRDVDASTKPLVARTLQRLMLEPSAVILSETSVDWRQMQSVFTRIAMMSKGQLAAIGPAEEVLTSIAKGYMARIKLKMVTVYREDRYRLFDEEASSESESESDMAIHTDTSILYAHYVRDFKNDFLKMFETSRLTGEHLSMLYFYIQDDDESLLYSEMFQKLQELKQKYDNVVEDYTLNVTTIEDVFWRLEHERQPEDITLPAPPPDKKKSKKSKQSKDQKSPLIPKK